MKKGQSPPQAGGGADANRASGQPAKSAKKPREDPKTPTSMSRTMPPSNDEPQRSGEKLEEEEEPLDRGEDAKHRDLPELPDPEEEVDCGDSSSEAAEPEEREPSRRNLGAMRPRAPSRSPQKPATSR